MFLKKITLVTLSALFLTAGCGNDSTPSSTADDKIKTLEAELKKEEEKNEQLQEAVSEKSDNDDGLVSVKPESNSDKTILGQAEWIYVSKAKQNFKTRIDTGASTSSINAVDIEPFERDSKKWVRFNVAHEKDAAEKMIEAPVERIAKVLQSNNPGEESERFVINLKVNIAGIDTTSEFTLTDRTSMEYPVLLGRTFIKDVVVVDVSKEYIHPKYKAKK